MQVSASEGLASEPHCPPNHALTSARDRQSVEGVRIGWVLSWENNTLGTPTLCFGVEGNTDGRASASAWTARRRRRPQHVCKLLAREAGDLVSGQDQ